VLIRFPAGETHKTRRTKQELEDRLAEIGAGRDAALVAVGGGVTGDLAGFVAATWHRGIPVVQVPTTLLAMADAALGGKTAVNLPQAKNLVGSFHQPWGVYADISVLRTLEDADFTDGFAEIVKTAAIADLDLFRWLESSVGPLVRRRPRALEHAVAECMRIKARIVARDERESGRRAALNFGHTLGHALETASGYRLRHGPAVAIGLCLEARLAEKETGFPPAHTERLRALLSAFGLPTRPPPRIVLTRIVDAIRRDKKARAGRARYALPLRLGRMPAGEALTRRVRASRLRGLLQS
jgi:3-dehydroquinate synthase